MKKTIKILAVLLAFCILSGMVVMADVPSDVVGTEYEMAVSKLTELSILTGYEDGTFRPEGTITRAEFSAIISRVIALDGETTEETESAGFTDVPQTHWATKYIDLAFSKGIINGYGNGLFGPSDKVTYEQAVKMIVCLLGFEAEAAEKGGYPAGYLAVAEEKEITKDTNGVVGESAPRGLIAQLIFNALEDEAEVEQEENEEHIPTTYYVSPDGSDLNPGTEDKPWATFRMAGVSAKAGDTVIFEDGDYYEVTVTTIANCGTKENPIVFKARNKHGAVLHYPETLRVTTKIMVLEKEYITIEDFAITQAATATEEDSAKTSDIMVHVRLSNNITVRGNKIYNIYEEGIKAYYCSGLLIEDNIVIDSAHEGIDFVNISDSIIRGNEIVEAGRVGLMIKGGSRSIQIYNNYIHNKEKYMIDTGITVGGSTDNKSTWNSTKDGYEGYNLVAFNNLVISEVPGMMRAGISLCAAKDSAIYNNTIIGPKNGYRVVEVAGTKKNWEWDPVPVNCVVKNNILMDCTENGGWISKLAENTTCDYNIYYNSPGAVKEPHGIYKNPRFVDELSDWHLLEEVSPAIAAGEAIEEFIGFSGQKIDISFDRDYNKRIGQWCIGAYEAGEDLVKAEKPGIGYQDPQFINKTSSADKKEELPEKPMPEKGTIVFEEAFADEKKINEWTVANGVWNTDNGTLNQSDDKAKKGVVLYNDGLWWSDYEYSIDVKAPTGEDNKNAGILFRSDLESKNQYAFRFCANNKMEFALWLDTSFVSVAIWDYVYTPNKVYNLKVSAVGDKFTFYVDGKEVYTATDGTHARGTVGAYVYNEQPGQFDNIKVTSMKQD